MRNTTALTLLTASACAAALAIAPAASAAHEELSAAGLTSGGTKVTTFDLVDGTAEKAVAIEGLDGDKRLVGIDYRVFGGDDTLYGVGDRGGIYTVDPETGATTKAGQLSVALEGTSFGVDFNPAANALRVISDAGQNLRQRFATVVDGVAGTEATLVDGSLNYGGTASGPVSSTGGTPALGVTGAAYTNNDADPATMTELFDIDTDRDQLVLQNPPNTGILVAKGSLGVDTSEVVGFDIYTEGTSNFAAAILTVGGERGLYSVNLTSGAATRIAGTDVTRGVSDIAVMP